MTLEEDLSFLWRQLTKTYQQLNSTTSTAEKQRLILLADMYRQDYRKQTSIATSKELLMTKPPILMTASTSTVRVRSGRGAWMPTTTPRH